MRFVYWFLLLHLGLLSFVFAQSSREQKNNNLSFYEVVNRILNSDLALSEEQLEQITRAAAQTESKLILFYGRTQSEGGLLRGEALKLFQSFVAECESVLDKSQLQMFRQIIAKLEPKKISFSLNSNN